MDTPRLYRRMGLGAIESTSRPTLAQQPDGSTPVLLTWLLGSDRLDSERPLYGVTYTVPLGGPGTLATWELEVPIAIELVALSARATAGLTSVTVNTRATFGAGLIVGVTQPAFTTRGSVSPARVAAGYTGAVLGVDYTVAANTEQILPGMPWLIEGPRGLIVQQNTANEPLRVSALWRELLA